MSVFFSKLGAFYLKEIHGDAIPKDAVEISHERHAELLEGQAQGKLIAAGKGGLPVLVDRPGPTRDQLVAAALRQVQERLDVQARKLGYDSMAAAVSYADEPAVPRFQDEGRALRAWRSLVWAAVYAVLEDGKAAPGDALAAIPSFNGQA